jgi:hypothetical protein
MPGALLEQVRKLAVKERRSLSLMLVLLIETGLANWGRS